MVDFIDMESRRDQFQLLEHFTSAIKDDSARPQIAQLTELGLVELTRKRQGQNIYELFGEKCSTSNGTANVDNKLNYEISNLQFKNKDEKPNNSTILKPSDKETYQSTDNQEKIIEKEFNNPKNLNKEDSLNKKENDDVNKFNSKEKNIVTIDLTNDENIVFSQLGINPLIKLCKEYLNSNNYVLLKDNSKENEKTLGKKKTTKKVRKTPKSKETEDIEINIEVNANSQDKATKKPNENIEVESLDKKDEIEFKDEINNARKKRRRSSAKIE